MKNNTYRGESQEQRLKRLQGNSYVEAIETLLNSIDNFFNNEVRLTPDNYQTSLLFMGIHASALTISEVFFNETGLTGYGHFLKHYVDGDTNDRKFSEIAKTIHDWRNVLAHQWLGSIGHQIGYDYEMQSGWEKRDNVTFVNPRIYVEQYLSAFKAGGKIWSYRNDFTEEQLNDIKMRIINKYLKN